MKIIFITLLLFLSNNVKSEGTIYTVQGLTGFFSDPQLACETRLSGDSRNITNIVYDPNLTPYNCTYYVDNDPSFFTYNMTQTTCPTGTSASITTGTCLIECPFGDTPSNGVCATEEPTPEPCGDGFYTDLLTDRCEPLDESERCPPGQSRVTNDLGLSLCEIEPEIIDCDPQTEYYNYQQDSCLPLAPPLDTKCDPGFYYDAYQFGCVPDSPESPDPETDPTPEPDSTDDGNETNEPANDENQEEANRKLDEQSELLRQIEDNTDSLEQNTNNVENLLESLNKTVADKPVADNSVIEQRLKQIKDALSPGSYTEPSTPEFSDNTGALETRKVEFQTFLSGIGDRVSPDTLNLTNSGCVNPTLTIPKIGAVTITICDYLVHLSTLGFLILLSASWTAINILLDT